MLKFGPDRINCKNGLKRKISRLIIELLNNGLFNDLTKKETSLQLQGIMHIREQKI